METGEFGLIDKIRDAFAALVPPGAEGIGDDCAVIPTSGGRLLLVTTDMLVEDVHFLRDKTTARELGRKALTVNLSDIAAMGGTPTASFLSISLPCDATGGWIDGFMAGYREVSVLFKVALMGGDTSSSKGGITINVTLLGEVAERKIKRRSGASPGDLLCVAGTLGDSAAGLQILLAGGAGNDDERWLVQAHNTPQFNVREGEWLGGLSGVTAMMDVSDGMASDVMHILRASGAGAAVELSAIPVGDAMRRVCRHRGWDCEKLAVTGGEDYRLLFTVKRDSIDELKQKFMSEFGYGITVTGEIVHGEPSIKWLRNGQEIDVNYKGYVHF